MKLGSELCTNRGTAPLTLHMQLGPPAVTLNEDGGTQEGGTTQGPDKGAEHERELQGPELGQEGGGPAPAEAVGDLWGEGKGKAGESLGEGTGKGCPKFQENKDKPGKEGCLDLQGEVHGLMWKLADKILPS